MNNWNEKGIIDVLIIGAGPTGLTAAVECLRLGLKLRIIERKQERQSTQSRALVVHSRTLEQLPMSISKKISDDCIPIATLNYKIGRNESVTEVHTKGFWMDDIDWPYSCGIPQYETERLIEEEVKKQGGVIEWGKSVKSARQEGGFVFTTIQNESDGREEIIQSKWLIGCDGGRSATRKEAGIGFEKKVGELFIISDFQVERPLPFKGIFLSLHPDGVLALFHISLKTNTYRAMIQPPSDYSEGKLNPTYLHNILLERSKINALSTFSYNNIPWLTAFNVVYALSESHREKNIFLAGDAVHLHSPVGGQGMNYGIQDAINLIWKLAWAKRYLLSSTTTTIEGKETIANSIMYDSYEAERRPLAKTLVKNTSRGMYLISIKNPIIKFIRNILFRIAVYFELIPKMIVNSLSMLDLAYVESSPVLFKSICSKGYYLCKCGERMPNLRTTKNSFLYHIIDRTRHSFALVHSSSSFDGGKIDLNDKGPGGLNVLHIVVDDKYLKSHAFLVRPDLYVAAVGDSADGIWDVIGNEIGVDARDCM